MFPLTFTHFELHKPTLYPDLPLNSYTSLKKKKKKKKQKKKHTHTHKKFKSAYQQKCEFILSP